LTKMKNLLINFFNALGENKYSYLRLKTNLPDPSEHYFSKQRIKPLQYIQIAKNELFMDIDLLSQGELQLLKLVLNIFAEQLRWDDYYSSEVATIVIDEIDLHLHPRWQRNLLPALMETFPNVQFIVTTHSPLIVSNVKAEHIVLLKDYKAYPLKTPTKGRDVNSILYEVFGVTKRPEKAAKMIETCGKMIEKAIDEDNWTEAKAKLDELRELFGDTDIDVVSLQATYNFYN
jgi:predicted ATP-binding protein involved in virulence